MATVFQLKMNYMHSTISLNEAIRQKVCGPASTWKGTHGFVVVVVVLGLEPRAYALSHSASPFL
jgi:hypothetical protein